MAVSQLGRYILVATALVALAACATDSTTSPDSVADASHKKGGTTTPTPTPPPTPDPTPAPGIPVNGNPIAGARFWIDPNSSAKQTADSWRASRPADAAQMDKIANGSQAQWFGGWSGDIFTAVSNSSNTTIAAGAMPVLVAYNIPQRDCGGLSAGGGASADAYKTWIAAFAKALAGKKAVVIVEPDALTQMDCLSAADQATRVSLIQYAVNSLKAAGSSIVVYLDGGHSAWKSASDQAARLTRANVAAADGFALNVSNFQYTANSIAYGKAVSALIGGKHFVIDTGRNGLGPTADNQWCNPAGRALGPSSTTSTADPLVDAYLWIKAPGESDGSCNGAPTAGAWWADYALGLAQRAI
jgi:endoglucanase